MSSKLRERRWDLAIWCIFAATIGAVVLQWIAWTIYWHVQAVPPA